MMHSLQRVRAAGILSVIVVFIGAILDMMLQLSWVDVLLSPWVIVPVFLVSYLLAPWVLTAFRIKETKSD